ncbi:MAG TPA: DUF3179 domain-containing protein, partial [Nitrosopumilus sp.]|nr:DUF3179 domain-containing protein [Nitrosopumilus sp.]
MNLKVLAPVIVIITILVVLAVSLQLESTAKITRDNLIETVDFGSSELAIMETKGVKHIIPLDKIKGGGPPKDGIPSIDNPIFATVQDSHFMSDSDTVIGLEMNGEAKAYPLFILVWHEIVNDNGYGHDDRHFRDNIRCTCFIRIIDKTCSNISNPSHNLLPLSEAVLNP